jgi:DUF1009 family protein
MQRVRETLSPEERLKKHARRCLDIADRIILEMRAQQLNIKKCAQYQKSMLDNLDNVMDGAKKIGNKPLFMHAAKLAEVVSQWHSITKQMSEDESLMIQFIAMTKSFYMGVIEYRDIVKDFSKTTKDFSSLKKFGLSIPKQIEVSSAEAAEAFQQLVSSLASIRVGYTRLTDYVLMDDKDEERFSKQFDEERQRLVGKQHTPEDTDK